MDDQKETAPEQITIQVVEVHKVGGADVVRLRWSSARGKRVDEEVGENYIPHQIAVSETVGALVGLPLPPKSACFFCPATKAEELDGGMQSQSSAALRRPPSPRTTSRQLRPSRRAGKGGGHEPSARAVHWPNVAATSAVCIDSIQADRTIPAAS